MYTELLRFGTLCAAYELEEPLPEESLFRRFKAEKGEPSFTVRVRRDFLSEPSASWPCVFDRRETRVYRTERGWNRRFSAVYDGVRREYAALDYTDHAAELTISPICQNPARCIESCTAFEHLALCAGALPLHAAQLHRRDGGIVFAGASGVGKSTQAALWERYRGAEIVNGDKALLMRENGMVWLAGIPYAGTSGICKNASAPLRAIVILEQGTENSATRLYGAQAVLRLMGCVIRNPWHGEDAGRAMRLAEAAAEAAPVFLLRCLPDESAVTCLERALEET